MGSFGGVMPLNMRNIFKFLGAFAFLALLLAGFQNCAKNLDMSAYGTEGDSLASEAPDAPGMPTAQDPPTITNKTANPSVTEGQSFSLSISAVGDDMTFSWSKDGALLPQATDASYTVNKAALSDAGTYRVLVSNSVGEVYAEFKVTVAAKPVTPPPPSPASITKQPTSLSTVTINSSLGKWVPSSVVLNVSATGTDLKYQWYFRGSKYGSYQPAEVAVSGANSSSYTVQTKYGQAMSTFCGTYRVVVSNSLKTVNSASAVVRCSAGGKYFQ